MMERAEWLEARRQGIGGSDAAAVLGVNPFKSPMTVYLDKLGELPEREPSEAMRQGTDFEAYVAQRFTEETGKRVRRCNRILYHPEHPFMLANIDRDVIGEDAGLECKTTSPFNKCDFDAGEVPAVYQWQCMHYMAVTGASHWYIAVLVLGQSFHVYRIDRDERLIEALIEREREFWEDHVVPRIPPLPTGSAADDDALGLLYPATAPEADPADLTAVRAALELLDQKQAEREALDAEVRRLQQEVKLILGDRETGNAGPWRVTWRAVESGRLDTKALRRDLPEIAERYTKTTTARVFRVRKEA